MNKQTKLAIAVLVVLFAMTLVFLKLNQPSSEEKQNLLNAGKFTITAGDIKKEVTIKDIEEAGVSEIAANYKPSGKQPTTRMYGGIPFSDLLDYLQVDTSSFDIEKATVVFTAIDGYTSAISLKEALDKELCAITISLDGKPLGDKTNGGSGPFMMVLPKEQFSQQWCKFLAEVTIQ